MGKVTRTISTRIAVEGERECQAAISNLSSEFKKLESNLKVVQNQYKNNANSIEALSAKSKALKDVQDVQTRSLEAAKKGFEGSQKATEEYRKTKERLSTEITNNKKKLDELRQSQGDSAEEEAKITAEVEKLNDELVDNQNRLDAAERGMNNWQVSINEAKMKLDDTNGELEKNVKHLDEAKNSTNGCATSIDKFGKSTEEAKDKAKQFSEESQAGMNALASALAAAGIAATIKEIYEALKACVGSSIEFESAIAGVAKTTDLSAEELTEMSEALKKMSTEIPLTTKELAGIAEAGGQLGIAKEDLLAFTETMAKLGTATNLTSDEAATMIAQFANVTGLSPDEYSNLGSAIVDLGNNSATTETRILELSQRFASAATVAGFSETDILGFATATASLGIESEAGGSALSKLTAEIQLAVETGKGLNDFATVAGMSADAFSRKWGTDAAGATVAFIQGLNDTTRNGKTAIAVLDDMGLAEVRFRNAVLALSKSGTLLTDSIEKSSSAFKDNTALNKEAATRYGTTESKVKLLNNSFNNLKIAVGDQLTPALGNLADAGKSVTDWATQMVQENEALVPIITAVVAGLAVMAGGIAAITVVSTVGAQALAAFKIALDTASGGVTFLITAVTAVIAALATLIISFADTESYISEEAQALSDSTERTSESFEDLQKKSEPLIERLNELSTGMSSTSETASGLSTAISGTGDNVGDFKGILTDLMFPVGDVQDALGNLGQAFDDLETSILEAVQAQYEFQAWEILNSGLSSQEKADALNDLGDGYRNVKEAVEDSLGGFENLFTSFESGNEITSEMVTTLEASKDAMNEYGVAINDAATTSTEQFEAMRQGYTQGAEATVSYQQSAQALAQTFGTEMSEGINATMVAIANYQVAQENSRAEIDEEITAMEGNIATFEKKGQTLDALVGRQQSYGNDTLAFLNSLTTEEKAILGQSDIDKISASTNLYDTLLTLQIGNGQILSDEKSAHNAKIEGKDTELNEKLKGNATDFSNAIQTIYGGMSTAQVTQMFEMMEASGIKVDDGYKKMVLSAVGFAGETQNSLEAEDFVGAMDKSIEQWQETTATGMKTTKENIETTINDIKLQVDGTKFQPLKVEFADIKVPRFSMSGSFNAKTGSVPSVNVDWYDKGGLFDMPQLIGIAEKRPEFVGAKEDLETFVSKSVKQAFEQIDMGTIQKLQNITNSTSNFTSTTPTINAPITLNITGNIDDTQRRKIVHDVRRELGRLIH